MAVLKDLDKKSRKRQKLISIDLQVSSLLTYLQMNGNKLLPFPWPPHLHYQHIMHKTIWQVEIQGFSLFL